MKRIDLHVHTNYSFDTDAENTFEAYCLKALQLGVEMICFTDHIEYNIRNNTFDTFEFDRRMEEFNNAKEKYKDKIKLLLGFEMGQPHLHPEIVKQLIEMKPDMIIGSIHYPEVKFNLLSFLKLHQMGNQFEQMNIDMIQAGNFDVVGHLDVLKKWCGNKYKPDIDLQKKAIELIVARGLVPEINTSSYRSRINEPMPGFDLLQYYQDCGGKYVTISSDAHRVCDLSSNYDDVIQKLPKGLKPCYFENRELIEL